MRLPIDELQRRIEAVLWSLGLSAERAALAARLMAETDRDGVCTHGIARLPRFARMVELGRIHPEARPERTAALGVTERWRGHGGPGNLAAYAAMQRAMELAAEHGLGLVALSDTTHWLRGGTYGWQAAEAGFAAMCWTNTLPNLPPWGATTPALGNNPLVLAIPHRDAAGENASVVLDMAMSQFSYGALAAYRLRGEALPVPGGFTAAGELTTDPGAIELSQRALPIGFWKGSGLAFALDLLAALLTGGKATHQIPADPLQEIGLSQVFLALSPEALDGAEQRNQIAQAMIDDLHAAVPILAGHPARYPGEATLRIRQESLLEGVSIDETTWAEFAALERATGS